MAMAGPGPASTATLPQWVQVDFNGTKSISEVDVFSIQDNYTNPFRADRRHDL